LKEDRGKERVLIVGPSMGGTAALVVAQDGSAGGVVAISAPETFEEQDALGAIAQLDVPVLLLASEDDTAAMLSLEALLEAAPGSTESETYSGNLHGTDLFQPGSPHYEAISERVLAFLDELEGG
jgi:pimeloyl-ACP methyl ester carboxylesterase